MKSSNLKFVKILYQDDGTSSNTETVLDVLKEKNVRATFFVNGINFENINDQSTHRKMRRIIEEV